MLASEYYLHTILRRSSVILSHTALHALKVRFYKELPVNHIPRIIYFFAKFATFILMDARSFLQQVYMGVNVSKRLL